MKVPSISNIFAGGGKPPFAVLRNPQPFAMSMNGDTAEITLYGDIVKERPTDWYGNPLEGQYILLDEFLTEFEKVKEAAHLNVRIHSAGGNAYDALVIHNRLKTFDGDITVIVDGVAMSAGSLIMCAGNKVQVYAGSIVMIHKCWSFLWGGYNADEMRSTADFLDTIDRSQAAIYHEKTGIKTDKLLEMMAAETYMVGEEAIEKGFADELIGGRSLEVAASADKRTLFVGGMPVWQSMSGIPAALKIPTVETGNNPVAINKSVPSTLGEGGSDNMAKTIDELRREHPELVEQIEAAAREAAAAGNGAAVQAAAETERDRLRAIDEVASLFPDELVQEAKYGETRCSAQEMTLRAAQRAVGQGRAFLDALDADANASGAGSIPSAPSGEELKPKEDMTPNERLDAARASVRAALGKKEDK